MIFSLTGIKLKMLIISLSHRITQKLFVIPLFCTSSNKRSLYSQLAQMDTHAKIGTKRVLTEAPLTFFVFYLEGLVPIVDLTAVIWGPLGQDACKTGHL